MKSAWGIPLLATALCLGCGNSGSAESAGDSGRAAPTTSTAELRSATPLVPTRAPTATEAVAPEDVLTDAGIREAAAKITRAYRDDDRAAAEELISGRCREQDLNEFASVRETQRKAVATFEAIQPGAAEQMKATEPTDSTDWVVVERPDGTRGAIPRGVADLANDPTNNRIERRIAIRFVLEDGAVRRDSCDQKETFTDIGRDELGLPPK